MSSTNPFLTAPATGPTARKDDRARKLAVLEARLMAASSSLRNLRTSVRTPYEAKS